MFKYITLTAIITFAQATDMSAYLGRARSVAIFPKLKLDYVELCPWYDVSLANVECTCGDNVENTDVKLLAFKNVPSNVTDAFIAISIVNTEEEALKVLTKYKSCKCGEKDNMHGVFRAINDKFYIQYMKNQADEKEPMRTIIVSKYEEKKSDIENIIQSVDELKTREYALLCEYNSN